MDENDLELNYDETVKYASILKTQEKNSIQELIQEKEGIESLREEVTIKDLNHATNVNNHDVLKQSQN